MSFDEEVKLRIAGYSSDDALRQASRGCVEQSVRAKYMYNFSWLSRPVIQYPQDVMAMQELIWRVRPDLIIETGIAHGGSLIFSASMLALLDMCDAIEERTAFDPRESRRRVLGIDVDIRAHNRAAIEAHPLASRIQMIQGSSVEESVLDQVRGIAAQHQRVLVCLDSNHTHDHVLAELNAYAPLVSRGSYCVVFDTIVDDLPASMFPDRPWGPGDNPKTAMRKYLETHGEFEIDEELQNKLMITVAPEGFLKRVR